MEDRDGEEKQEPTTLLLATTAEAGSDDSEEWVSEDDLLRTNPQRPSRFLKFVNRARSSMKSARNTGNTEGNPPVLKTSKDRCGRCPNCKEKDSCRGKKPSNQCGGCKSKQTCFNRKVCTDWTPREIKFWKDEMQRKKDKWERAMNRLERSRLGGLVERSRLGERSPSLERGSPPPEPAPSVAPPVLGSLFTSDGGERRPTNIRDQRNLANFNALGAAGGLDSPPGTRGPPDVAGPLGGVLPPAPELPRRPERQRALQGLELQPPALGTLPEAYQLRIRELEEGLTKARLEAELYEAQLDEQAMGHATRERDTKARLQDVLNERNRELQKRRDVLDAYHGQWERDNPKPQLWPNDWEYNPENLNAYRAAQAHKATGARPKLDKSRLGSNHLGFGGNGSQYFGLKTNQQPAPRTHANFFPQSLASAANRADNVRRNATFTSGGPRSSTPNPLQSRRLRPIQESQIEDFLSTDEEDPPDPQPEPGQTAIDRLTDAMTLLVRSNQGGRASGYSARNPAWQFVKLAVGPNGECKALTYHTWKKRTQQNISRLKIDEEAAIMELQQNTKVLPKSLQNLILNCDTLEMIWRRLDENFPHIETTENELVAEVVCRPECPNDPNLQVPHCDALMSAIENKTRVHPHHFLNRTQAMATLGSFRDLDLTNTMLRLDQEAEVGVCYEQSLYDFLVDFRKSKMDIQTARGLFMPGHLERASHLLFRPKEKVVRGRGDQEKATTRKLASGGSEPNFKDLICVLCNLVGHPSFNCTRLLAIRLGKDNLPKGLCKRCLKPVKEAEPHPENCHTVKSKGKEISFLCFNHKDPPRHYKICRACGTAQAKTAVNLVRIANEK